MHASAHPYRPMGQSTHSKSQNSIGCAPSNSILQQVSLPGYELRRKSDGSYGSRMSDGSDNSINRSPTNGAYGLRPIFGTTTNTNNLHFNLRSNNGSPTNNNGNFTIIPQGQIPISNNNINNGPQRIFSEHGQRSPTEQSDGSPTKTMQAFFPSVLQSNKTKQVERNNTGTVMNNFQGTNRTISNKIFQDKMMAPGTNLKSQMGMTMEPHTNGQHFSPPQFKMSRIPSTKNHDTGVPAAVKMRDELKETLTALESVDEAAGGRQRELSNQMLGVLSFGAPDDGRISNVGMDQHNPARRESARTSLRASSVSNTDHELDLVPPDEGEPWTREHLNNLIESLQKYEGKTIPPEFVSRVLTDFAEANEKFAATPVRNMTVPKDGKFIIVGDTHGQLNDVLWILYKNGMPGPQNTYLFNGDIADRGTQAIEIFVIVYLSWLLYPDNFSMNRGNHEDAVINMDPNCGGFYKEISNKYGSQIGGRLWDEVVHTYTMLPVATIINEKIFVVHGGLARIPRFLPSLRAMLIRKPTIPEAPRTPEEIAYVDAMWSDPQPDLGISPSTRGPSLIKFGPDITQQFLQENNLIMVIRSHQPPPNKDGVYYQHNGRLITVFSASNYCGWYGNTGAVIILLPNLQHQAERHYSPTFENLQSVNIVGDTKCKFERKKSVVLMESEARRDSAVNFQQEVLLNDIKSKLARIIVENKTSLWNYYLHEDVNDPKGTVTEKTFRSGLELAFGTEIPNVGYDSIIQIDKVTKRVDYLRFLQRYRCEIREDGEEKIFKTSHWIEILLSALYDRLMREDLGWYELKHKFDGGDSGHVSVVDFHRELVISGSGGLTMDQTNHILRAMAIHAGSDHITDKVDVVEFLGRLESIYSGTQRLRVKSRSSNCFSGSLLRSLGKAMSQERAVKKYCIAEMFENADKDRTGKISKDNFRSAMREIIVSYPQILQESGLQSDDYEEPIGNIISDEMIDSVFEFADISGDGLLNYLEFIHSFHDSLSYDADRDIIKICLMEQIATVIFMHKGALHKTFQLYDQNHSQMINKEDFKRVLSALNSSVNVGSPPITREQIELLVVSLDWDHNEIDYLSFLDAFQIVVDQQ